MKHEAHIFSLSLQDAAMELGLAPTLLGTSVADWKNLYSISKQCVAKEYALNVPEHFFSIMRGMVEYWQGTDRLVIKGLQLFLGKLLRDKLQNTCHHVKGNGGVRKASEETHNAVKSGAYKYVFRTDVKGYYKHISHRVLLRRLNELTSLTWVHQLVWDYCQKTMQYGGTRDCGIPLGGSLSPLLTAIYLSEIDEAFAQPCKGGRKHERVFYARFMDDWVILTNSHAALQETVRKCNALLSSLKVWKHPDKTFIGKLCRGFTFLGYHFTPSGIVGFCPRRMQDTKLHLSKKKSPSSYAKRIMGREMWWVRQFKSCLRGVLSVLTFFVMALQMPKTISPSLEINEGE